MDIRRGSPTYGRHVAVELSGANWRQLLVPVGFAHGYCTLEENTEVLYKVDGPYAPAAEGGLLWNDPALGIDWPGFAGSLVSERDMRHGPRSTGWRARFPGAEHDAGGAHRQ